MHGRERSVDYPEDEFWFSTVAADPEDDENVAPERLTASTDYGVTAWEETHHEPLSRALAREVPEPGVESDADVDGDDEAGIGDRDDEDDPAEQRARVARIFGEQFPRR